MICKKRCLSALWRWILQIVASALKKKNVNLRFLFLGKNMAFVWLSVYRIIKFTQTGGKVQVTIFTINLGHLVLGLEDNCNLWLVLAYRILFFSFTSDIISDTIPKGFVSPPAIFHLSGKYVNNYTIEPQLQSLSSFLLIIPKDITRFLIYSV